MAPRSPSKSRRRSPSPKRSPPRDDQLSASELRRLHHERDVARHMYENPSHTRREAEAALKIPARNEGDVWAYERVNTARRAQDADHQRRRKK